MSDLSKSNKQENSQLGKEPNIIILLLDGLRQDRINLCPFLSNILKQGYFFSNMVTAAPYTLASFHSIFSSLYPSKNGVDSYYSSHKFKGDKFKTMTQYLKENGYYTTISIGNEIFIPNQGFDDICEYDEFKDDYLEIQKDIITNHSKEKFFLFLHDFNIHTETIRNIGKKYDNFSKEYFENYEDNKKLYNSYLKKTDLYIKEIYNHLKELNLLENTLLVILSDHGVSNGEKVGEKMYGSFLYDYTIKTFCSFIIPNIKGKEIKFQTRTIDIMPTILDILNIKLDDSYEKLQGSSLMPFIEGTENEDRIAFSETGALKTSPKESNVFGVRLRDWKIIYNKTSNKFEIYNLEKDPEEKNNLFGKDKEFTSKLKKILLGFIEKNN